MASASTASRFRTWCPEEQGQDHQLRICSTHVTRTHLVTQILSHIPVSVLVISSCPLPPPCADSRLVENYYPRRVQFPGVHRRPRRHAKALHSKHSMSDPFLQEDRGPTYQWHIRHAKHHYALVLGRVLRYPSQVRLDDVVAVQERQLSRRLDPDLFRPAHVSQAPTPPLSACCAQSYLVFGIPRKPVEAGYAELELARLAELAHARPERDEVWPRDRSRKVHRLDREVVHASGRGGVKVGVRNGAAGRGESHRSLCNRKQYSSPSGRSMRWTRFLPCIHSRNVSPRRPQNWDRPRLTM